jgi:hypothetical protein
MRGCDWQEDAGGAPASQTAAASVAREVAKEKRAELRAVAKKARDLFLPANQRPEFDRRMEARVAGDLEREEEQQAKGEAEEQVRVYFKSRFGFKWPNPWYS